MKPVIKVQSIYPAIEENREEYYRIFAPITDLVASNPLIDYLQKDSEDMISHIPDFSCPQIYQRLVIGDPVVWFSNLCAA